MSKQFSACFTLIGIGALVIGLAGCGSAPPPPPVNKTAPMPSPLIENFKHMDAAQQQQVLQQEKGTPQGDQLQKIYDSMHSGSASGG